jgi:hypothetical protein
MFTNHLDDIDAHGAEIRSLGLSLKRVGEVIMEIQRESERIQSDMARLQNVVAAEHERLLRRALKVAKARRRALSRGL